VGDGRDPATAKIGFRRKSQSSPITNPLTRTRTTPQREPETEKENEGHQKAERADEFHPPARRGDPGRRAHASRPRRSG
jgi:hypothetical protein